MTPDYARGFNDGLERAMEILHERCATTFDPMLKRAKVAVPKSNLQVYNPETDAFEPWSPYTREEA